MLDNKRETGKPIVDTEDITWDEFEIQMNRIVEEIKKLVDEKENEK
jgi:hypothetical protein